MGKLIVAMVVASLAGIFLIAWNGEEAVAPANKTTLHSTDLIATISNGEEINVQDELEDGVYTLFEFYADW